MASDARSAGSRPSGQTLTGRRTSCLWRRSGSSRPRPTCLRGETRVPGFTTSASARMWPQHPEPCLGDEQTPQLLRRATPQQPLVENPLDLGWCDPASLSELPAPQQRGDLRPPVRQPGLLRGRGPGLVASSNDRLGQSAPHCTAQRHLGSAPVEARPVGKEDPKLEGIPLDQASVEFRIPAMPHTAEPGSAPLGSYVRRYPEEAPLGAQLVRRASRCQSAELTGLRGPCPW